MDKLIKVTQRVSNIMTRLHAAGWDPSDSWSIEGIDLPEGMHYGCGASRIVVWDSNHDYVIKFGISEDDDKYCDHEVELYEKAVEEGVADQFGWCAYIGEFYGRKIYAMEFLECNYDGFDDESYQWGYERYCSEEDLDSDAEESKRKFSNAYWGSELHNELVFEWFEQQLPLFVAKAFDRFINKYQIEDIHPGNIGRRGTDLVLCDYAGWGW